MGEEDAVDPETPKPRPVGRVLFSVTKYARAGYAPLPHILSQSHTMYYGKSMYAAISMRYVINYTLYAVGYKR